MYHNYIRELRDLVDTLEFIEPVEAIQYVDDLQNVTNNLIKTIQKGHNCDLIVELGQEFKVERDENLSTGYSWEAIVSNGLEIIGDEKLRGGRTSWLKR